jgi:UDP-2,3-diacylglucosamine hydrolase
VNTAFVLDQNDKGTASEGALAIIAGGGRFPGDLAAAAIGRGRRVVILALEGAADPQVVAPFPHAFVRWGSAGRIRRLLEEHGARDIVMIGTVRRPGLREILPDWEGVRVLARLGRSFFGGDDDLLSAVVRVLTEYGYRVVGVQDVLADVLAPAGVLTRAAPEAAEWDDIVRGQAVASMLGSVDVGQGCVVQQGLVLAVEAIEGTDAMLARAGPLARPGRGGVLIKLVKPGQERRVDLPAIGPTTVANAAAAGLRGIAVSAGAALIADRARTIADADAAGLFLVGLDAHVGAGKPEETA